MKDVKWLSIEIGHVANGTDTGLTDEQRASLKDPQLIMSKFKCTARNEWAQGGTFKDCDTTNDNWVATKLEVEINKGLYGNVGPVKVNELHYVAGFPEMKTASEPFPSSDDPGTQCRLRGDRWINVRTYVLTNPDGKPWLIGELTQSHVAIATLVWECQVLGACDLAGNAKPKA